MLTSLRGRLAARPLITLTGRLALLLLPAALLWLNRPPASAAPASAAPAAAAPAAEALTLDDRLTCRTAVEEVYWAERIWPEANSGPKPGLSEVVTPAGIAALVDESLAQSLALEQFWQAPITGAMLQAEVDRMAAASRQPAVLQALFATLDHDPVLVAECLARPLLAERLLHDRFENDPRFAGQPFADWWAANRPDPAGFEAPAYDYRLPAVAARFGSDDSWQDTPSVPLDDINGDVEGAAVWTGSEMVFMGDFDREAYRYNPATDSWQTASTLGGPLGLRDMAAVWTGTYVVASHGCTANNHNCTVSLAWRYDPQIDFWEPIPNAPMSRTDLSAVWTGSEMIVWGGCTYFNNQCVTFSQLGARYNPDTNSWQTMPTANAPAGRTFPNLVWSGTEMIVWGGWAGDPAGGGRYDPASDTWSAVSATGAPTGAHSTAVWAGSKMIAWGGCTGSPFCDTPVAGGAAYDPAGDSWTAVSATNAPEPRFDHEAVWTGQEMILWGGYNGSSYLNSGGRYNPATDSWTATSTAGAPTGRAHHAMLWADNLVLVWGGSGLSNMRSGGRYNPISDGWSAINTEDPDSFRTSHMAVWTGAEMVVWGGVGDGTANSGLSSGRRYDPATNNWAPIATAGAPPGSWDAAIVWSGLEVIVFGGQSGTLVRDTGGLYNPATNSWTAMTTHLGHTDGAYVWTGSEMLVWGGIDTNGSFTNAGARFNPATNSWTDISTSGAPSGRQIHDGFAWTGEELLVWGGYNNIVGELGDGGRYNLSTDTWAPISSVNAPEARVLQVSVWTGSEMIVWGGAANYPQPLNTGGRYNPATDSWTATSTVDTPWAVARPRAVWTGAEMIVWGGECDVTDITCHTDSYKGGRYNPATDSWTPTTLDGVPEARSNHTAVWTGSAMIVYGGTGTWSGYRHTGGLYYASAPPNSLPVANDDSYSAVENELLIVAAPGVLTNDTDPDGNNLSAVLETTTISGTLVLIGDGSFTYQPDPGFIGVDTFTYRAFDGLGYSDPATVTITVSENPNSAPIAADDSYTVEQDQTLTVAAPGLLANDSDPDGDPLTAALLTDPAHGSVTVNADGSFSYTPDSGFIGVDTFTYRAFDGLDYSNPATVTITVSEEPNSAPIAADDSYTVGQDQTLIVAAPGLLANDSDPDGDPLTAALLTGPAHGSVTVNADGSFSYTPDSGFTGVDTFTYTVDDGRGGQDTAVVTITVTEVVEFFIYLPLVLNTD
jgi:N-acetylneuraminic acid mutarotase